MISSHLKSDCSVYIIMFNSFTMHHNISIINFIYNNVFRVDRLLFDFNHFIFCFWCSYFQHQMILDLFKFLAMLLWILILNNWALIISKINIFIKVLNGNILILVNFILVCLICLLLSIVIIDCIHITCRVSFILLCLSIFNSLLY